MSSGRAVTRRLTSIAVGRHLPRRTIRIRLTVLYGGLFLLSGAALMAITYVLLVNAGFVFTLQSGPSGPANQTPPARSASPASFPTLGAKTHPSAQTMAYWQGVASCMRQHGVRSFPDPTTSVPSHLAGVGSVNDRDGALLVFPASLNTRSATFTNAAAACGYAADSATQLAQENHRRTSARTTLLLRAGIALAGMSLLSLGLGWLMAGRVLQPLEASYEAQRQFVANASHELRAPLTRQRALIQVALADPEANVDSLRNAHRRVLASEQHLEQMIDGLLELTRSQAGTDQRQELDLAALTADALRTRQTDIAEAALEVHASLSRAPAPGDPRLLERLIANLLDNAIRHSRAGGHVELTTGVRDRRAFVSIVNSGAAVPPEQIERLRRPFQRLEERTGHGSGHGLGLSIVQAIAEAHRAELTIEARPAGGLAVEVTFPPSLGASAAPRAARRLMRRSEPRPRLQDS